MSTITVVKKGNKICIASETLTTFGSTKLRAEFASEPEKIIKWGNSFVGMVGSVSLNLMIRDVIRNEKKAPSFASSEEIYKYFTKMHEVFKEKYFLNPTEDEDDPVESSQFELVIVNKHGIFGVHSLREVYNFKKFWAYGSGRRYALGAMNSTYSLDEFDAEKIAIKGVEAGVTFDDGSSGDVQFKTVNCG